MTAHYRFTLPTHVIKKSAVSNTAQTALKQALYYI
jgi:hypothetical protein